MVYQNKETDDDFAEKNECRQNGRMAGSHVYQLPSGISNSAHVTQLETLENVRNWEEKESVKEPIVSKSPQQLLYGLHQTPPFLWTILFACQQAMVSIANPLTHSLVVCEMACSLEDDVLKVRILSATFFMVGLGSFVMCTFGVRLPIFQGPSFTYIIPLLALRSLEDWKCPRTFKALDPTTNTTVLMADMGNGTFIPNRDFSLRRISEVSGSLVAAGVVHFLIGLSGLVGVLTRYIGPVTIVPTIALVGIHLYPIYVTFSRSDWIASFVVLGFCLILALYMTKLNTPIPRWNKRRGFYIDWQPIHQLLSILLTIIFGCILSAILTASNVYSDDPESKRYMARIDARSSIISETNWFIFPYPGQFGPISFRPGIFLSFLVSTFSSVLESIGDYTACARIVQVAPPPAFAFNRGIFVEGLMTTLSGFMGSCDGNVSYGQNMAAMRITKVTSLRVLQSTAVIYIGFAIFGKLGAAFVAIPYPILGAVTLATMGMFIGVLISHLQAIDLNSNRNVAIIGMTLILGFAIPNWIKTYPDDVNTGSPQFDRILRMVLSNPAFSGGIFSTFLDNTIPGTSKERGLLHGKEDSQGNEAKDKVSRTRDTKCYRLPFLPDSFHRSRFTKYTTIFDSSEAGTE